MPICRASSSTFSAVAPASAASSLPSRITGRRRAQPGHGDFHVVVFAPSTVQEMSDLAFAAFDVADKYRTPVMILGDGMLGQMMEPVELPDPVDPADLPEKPWATVGHKHKRTHNVANFPVSDR